MNRKTGMIPAVGVSSLLVIFVVLCMTVFAMLALETVQADRRLTDASIRAAEAYYAADAEAEAVYENLRRETTEEGEYSYSVPISAAQTLEVTVSYADGSWCVLRWQAVVRETWEESSPQLWDGEQAP